MTQLQQLSLMANFLSNIPFIAQLLFKYKSRTPDTLFAGLQIFLKVIAKTHGKCIYSQN